MTQATPNTATAREDDVLIPAVDVIEDPQGILLIADLPGVPKEQLNIQVDGDLLTLEGAIALPVPQGITSIHAEIEAPRFRRAFTLSRELDAERVEAELRHGVLRLRIPKKAHAQPRRIEVQID